MMFSRFICLLTISTIFMLSCKKDVSAILVGKWSIVSDRMSWTNAQTSASGDSVYIGQSTDYYDFTSHNNLFIREGASFDTADYSFLSSNKIQIKYFSLDGVSFGPAGAFGQLFTISNATSHSVTLSSSVITPGGLRAETLTLKR